MSPPEPLVSKRISIAWPPHVGHHETTDTFVLTGSRYFLDLRILNDKEKPDSLDWGIAGIKEKLGNETGNSKAKWTYILNSRTSMDPESGQLIQDPEDLSDIGSMTILDNGDVMEIGSMLNVDYGRVMDYEEIWRDLEIPSDSPVCIIESTWDKVAGKAFVGQIGQWQMGLSAQPATNNTNGEVNIMFSAWRDVQRDDGNWHKLYQVGNKEDLPPRLPANLRTQGWKEGGKLKWEGREWTVRELFWTCKRD